MRPELLVCAMEVIKNSEASITLVELQMMEVMCLMDNLMVVIKLFMVLYGGHKFDSSTR